MEKRKKQFDWAMLGIIFTLAWPTMLEQLLQTAVQYIDVAMVGTLGTDATAAVGSTSTVNWLFNGIMNATGVGFLAYIARATGARDEQRVHRASAQAVFVTVTEGLILTALACSLSSLIPVWMQVDAPIQGMASRYFLILYIPMLFRCASFILGTVLRAVGDTKTPMLVGLVMNLTNIVLNFLFIYPTRTVCLFSRSFTVWGTGWGVEGAAIASAVSYFVGGILITIAFWRHPQVSPRGQSFKPDPHILAPCFRVAIPNMCQRFATSLGYVVFAAMINALGELSTAAHTIANTVESAFYIPGWGMQAAAATLAGQSYGAQDERRLRSLGRTILALEVGLMTVSGGLLFFFAQPLVGIFSRDPQVIALGTTVLKMVAISEPFYGIPIVVDGLMQGVGKTVPPLVFNVLGMWCVRIVGTYICTRLLGLGLVSAWGCMIGHNMTLCCLFSIYYLTGRWNPMYRKKDRLLL